jgi:hypothetical protein
VNDDELGRRAVACRHWKWMPGMLLLSLDDDPIRIDGTQDGHPYREEDCGTYFPKAPFVPDLSDPATLGCLLHLVREATGQQSSPSWYSGGKHDYPHWAWYSDNCYGKLCE